MSVLAVPPFLAPEFTRLDALLRRAVVAMRTRRALSAEEFRGLTISDAQIDAALSGYDQHASGAPIPQPTLDPSPWREVLQCLSLSPAERDVLLLGLSTQIDRRYEAVIAYLNDAQSLRDPTVDLAWRLFAGQEGLVRALAPAGRLTQLNVIETTPAVPSGAWRGHSYVASDVIALRLLGAKAEDLVPGLSRVAQGPPPEACDVELAQRIGACHPAPILVLPPDAEDAACLHAGARRPVRYAPDHHATDPAAMDRLALAAKVFGLLPIVFARPDQIEAIQQRWPLDLPLALTTPPRMPPSNRPILALPHTSDPCATERLWSEISGCSAGTAQRLAATYRLPAARVRSAALAAALDGGGAEALARAARGASQADFGPLAQPLPADVAWDRLVLAKPTEAVLEDLVQAVLHRHRVLGDWGFSTWAGGSGALTMLFSGPSGTGKTMAASALAARTGLNLFRIDLSAVVDKYIGETEKNLDRLFDAAESSAAILLFDEADALFGKRAETREAKDRYANFEVSYLLQRIESLPPGSVVILTTNLAKNMDTAFVRRLTHVVDFPRPSADLRKRLWMGIFPPDAPLETGFDPGCLADGFDLSGGEIRQVALDAAFRAAAQDQPIGLAHVVAALRRHYEKLGRSAPDRALTALNVPQTSHAKAAE